MYVVYILNHLAHSQLNGQTPIYAAFGTTPDISALLLFYFYQRVLYHQKNTPFPGSKELSGRFVGIAENVGDALMTPRKYLLGVLFDLLKILLTPTCVYLRQLTHQLMGRRRNLLLHQVMVSYRFSIR